SQPNLGASSRQMSNTEAQLLPAIRQLEAAAEEGKSALLPGYKQTTASALEKQRLGDQIASLQSKISSTQDARSLTTYKAQLSALQSQYEAIPEGGGTVYVDKHGKIVPPTQAVANFAGYSQADIQGTIMQQMAQDQLAQSQKYDSQFIQSALDQEKLADPQSFAARQELYDLIQKQINNPPTSPVADEMQRQVQEKVDAGSGLTPDEQNLLAAAVASGAGDRGGTGTGADFSHALTTGFAGDQRALANAGSAEQFLASGETPEDIAYRAEQQNLGNLGNYIGGRTPQSQFRELSGASQGPTPNTTGGAAPLTTMPSNAGQLGASAATQGYGLAVQAALGQPNPWMAGLSSMLGAANVAGAAGWKPLATQPQTATP
ncbi:MAG: hypothetical protein KGL39_45510, partial [Patescibacteria group bacterium]|nr:hypothetical protein [Patescibacteria group bacterium]